MVDSFITPKYAKVLLFVARSRAGFTANDLRKKVKCSERTARFYCTKLKKKGLVSKKNTFPAPTYFAKRAK